MTPAARGDSARPMRLPSPARALRCALLLTVTLLAGCDDDITAPLPDPMPDPMPDAAPSDAMSDGMPLDEGMPPDLAYAIDDGMPDGTLDRALPMDARPDMPSLPVDATPDARPDLAAPVDAAPADAAPPDATRDLYLPDFAGIESCVNQRDDDDDGLIDCGDPDCRGSGACFHIREDCHNGIDDDGDLHADCDDAYCLVDPACPAPEVEPYTTEALQRRFDFECLHCHGPINPFSGLELTAPFEDAIVDVLSAQVAMPLVKSGDRQQSFLYLKLTWHHLEVGGDGEGMPPEGEKWSAADAERLGRWIDGLGTD